MEYNALGGPPPKANSTNRTLLFRLFVFIEQNYLHVSVCISLVFVRVNFYTRVCLFNNSFVNDSQSLD